ncbi:extradiol ring-cleavage dioxygenase [Pseudonocardia sp. H11422]|uniref:extradiol ring-cleavage dioxygenase n=1 Tax=Pseudonocardia sp. H11422 TaxID=2835866 RepID=UPI001BDBECC1|nr:extradiol ring-cleavage dioxygenase [Pseudonocardia sp. H11422]
MAEVLGIGLSHYPPFSGTDEDMAGILRRTLQDPDIPEREKDPANWPDLMRREWGTDEGRSSASQHRAALIKGFERTRQALDEFGPDVVVIWGDDQYENFREDIIPPYAVLAYDDIEVRPWAHAADSSDMKGRPNVWDEGPDRAFTVRGAPEVGRHLATQLLERGVDIPYAYRRLHHPGLPHAFLNAILYLDYHREGFDYPVLPFPINCYGRRVVSYKGFMSAFGDVRELDPPSPQPSRLFDIGATVAEVFAESPWRVALVASSSWSHAFICDKTWRLRPDTDGDRRLFDALATGDVDAWRSVPLSMIEDAGQQELLNWFPLLGAMKHLGRPTPTWSEFIQTDVFNSNKVFATYEP